MLTYGGKPAFTQFGSSSGGWTSAGSQPYLAAKADPYDGFSGNPVHTWTKTLTRAPIQKAYPSLGTLKRVVVTQRDGHGEWYGRVEKLVLDGTKNERDRHRRRLPLQVRPALELVPLRLGSSTPTPAADAGPTSRRLADHQRWRAIGGYHSVVGRPKGAEYAVADGRARVFKHGRIYYKATSARTSSTAGCSRPTCAAAARLGKLGFPLTSPQQGRQASAGARFEHGTITVRQARQGARRSPTR